MWPNPQETVDMTAQQSEGMNTANKRVAIHLSDNSVIWWELLTNMIVCYLTYSEQNFSTTEGDFEKGEKISFLIEQLSVKKAFDLLGYCTKSKSRKRKC